jgi:hypothetical protein
MSLGGGQSSSSNKSTSIPKWALPFFQKELMPQVQKLFGTYDQTGGTTRSLADQSLQSRLSGSRLDSSTNAPLQETLDAIASRGFENLGHVQAGNARANQVTSGSPFDTKALQISAMADRKALSDIGQQQSALKYGDYRAERGSEDAAQQPALAMQGFDLSKLMGFIEQLRADSSRGSSSSWNASGGIG